MAVRLDYQALVGAMTRQLKLSFPVECRSGCEVSKIEHPEVLVSEHDCYKHTTPVEGHSIGFFHGFCHICGDCPDCEDGSV